MANMPGCENEPYHDDTFHPVLRMISAVPMVHGARDGIEKKFKDYAGKLDNKVSKDSYRKNKNGRGNGRGDNRNLRSLQSCFVDICKGKSCSWCLQNDILFGRTCSCGRRRGEEVEEQQPNPEDDSRTLEAIPYTSNRNCFNDLQDEDCSAQIVSMELSAREMKIPYAEIKCFLIPSDSR
jgi:hypothetical protein